MKRRMSEVRTYRSVLAMLLACLMLSTALAGGGSQDRGDTRVNIKNFGQVNDHIYRGGQPEGDDYRKLAAIGINTIVDLTVDNERAAKAAANAAGLRYINLPMKSKDYPKKDAAKRFLDIVDNPENGVVYVHCAGGRHRTGAMIAVYRMSVDGWNLDRAYQEMKDYDFYTSWGHGCYRDYVQDYYRSWQASNQQPVKKAGAVTHTGN